MHDADIKAVLFRGALRLAILLSAAASTLRADTDTQLYGNPTLKFELHYPSQMVPADPHNAAAPLFLLFKGGTHPSFNVVVEPQVLTQAELTLAGQAERVSSAYRKLGLTDVKLIEQRESVVGGKRALSFRLQYGSKDKSYTSEVTIIPRAKFLYTLTFIDSSAAFTSSRELLQIILDSFVSSDGDAGEAPPPRSRVALYSVVLLCLAFLIALALRMRRRMMPS